MNGRTIHAVVVGTMLAAACGGETFTHDDWLTIQSTCSREMPFLGETCADIADEAELLVHENGYDRECVVRAGVRFGTQRGSRIEPPNFDSCRR